MPARTGSSDGITIGFYGRGEMDTSGAQKVVEDYLSSTEATPRFIFIVTTESATNNLREMLDFAVESDIPYDAIHDAEALTNKRLKPFLDAADKCHSTTAVDSAFIKLLTSKPQPVMFCFWDEEPTTEAVIKAAAEHNVIAQDLTSGLDQLVLDDTPEEPEEDEEATVGPEQHTKATLDEMSRTELRSIATEYGLEVARGMDTDDLIAQILTEQCQEPDTDENEYDDDPEPTLAPETTQSDAQTEAVLSQRDPSPLDDLIAHYEALLAHLVQLRTLSGTTHAAVLYATVPKAPPGESLGQRHPPQTATSTPQDAPGAPQRQKRHRRTKAEMAAARAAEEAEMEPPSTGAKLRRGRTVGS